MQPRCTACRGRSPVVPGCFTWAHRRNSAAVLTGRPSAAVRCVACMPGPRSPAGAGDLSASSQRSGDRCSRGVRLPQQCGNLLSRAGAPALDRGSTSCRGLHPLCSRSSVAVSGHGTLCFSYPGSWAGFRQSCRKPTTRRRCTTGPQTGRTALRARRAVAGPTIR